MRTIFRTFVVLLLLAIAAGGLASWYVLHEFDAPGPAASNGEPETNVSLPMGTGLNQVAAILEKQGVVRDGLVFRAGVLVNRKAAALKAGEYAIPSGASPSQIMNILIEGKSIVYKLTLAEGLTSAMIVDLVRNHKILVGDVTEVPPEGSLLPETYIFDRGTTRASLIKKMQDDHTRVLDELWAGRAPNL
ncbi:MAG: endolytic transglycosylase MltG, partial [Alphaproteobacteria bacterium]|nr:endolytic transglycosylase MltG [Alphaproteobacteria bacterium]